MKKYFAIALFLIVLAPAAFGQTPQYQESLLTRGYECYKGGDYSCAITEFDQALRQQPDWAKAFLLRGNAHRARKDYVRAIADYSDAIRFKSDYAVAFNNRADVWFRLSDYDRALADINEAVRLRPTDAIAIYNRSIAYRALGMNEEAKADLLRVLELDPQHAYAGLSLQKLESETQLASVATQEASPTVQSVEQAAVQTSDAAPVAQVPVQSVEYVEPLRNAISQVNPPSVPTQVAANQTAAPGVSNNATEEALAQQVAVDTVKDVKSSEAARTEIVAIPPKPAARPQEKSRVRRFFSWMFGGKKKSQPQNSARNVIRIPMVDHHRTGRA